MSNNKEWATIITHEQVSDTTFRIDTRMNPEFKPRWIQIAGGMEEPTQGMVDESLYDRSSGSYDGGQPLLGDNCVMESVYMNEKGKLIIPTEDNGGIETEKWHPGIIRTQDWCAKNCKGRACMPSLGRVEFEYEEDAEKFSAFKTFEALRKK